MTGRVSRLAAGVRLTSLLLAVLFALAALADSQRGRVNTDSDNLAILGYDTVAYFTLGQATPGREQFAVEWQDARWLFNSAAHRDLFAANPISYAPQFGGFCAGAITHGVKVAADPEAWTIVDGKLYMNVSKESRGRWAQNPEKNIEKGDEHWVGLMGPIEQRDSSP